MTRIVQRALVSSHGKWGLESKIQAPGMLKMFKTTGFLPAFPPFISITDVEKPGSIIANMFTYLLPSFVCNQFPDS